MSPVTHQPYCASLLLAGPAGGEVCKVLGLRVAFDPPVLERERVKVDRAPVNNVHNGELGLSAKRAGTVALQLLFREINHNQPVQRLWIDIDPPSLQVTGRSAELLFGLVAYLHLGAPSLPKGVPDSDFMATGLLDPDGNVGSVEAVAVKVRAALASGPKVGTRLFYPRADEAQIGDDLRAECRSLGLILCPVDRIDEALDALGVPILGSWPSSLSPFRALEAFDTRFSRVFFGRQREVEALTSLLEARAAAGRPGALVIGASGAGKSSFCLAGVLPALIKRKPGLQYAVWRPRDAASGLGDEPADEQRLAQSILSQWQVRDEKQLGMALAAAPEGAPSLQDLPACLAAEAGQCSVFVIDQFEELFTLNFTPQARIGFARLLQSLQARGIWVIGTLRSEFYASYLELADEEGQVVLTPLFEGDGQYNLPRMSRDAFSQVITRPAELAGLQFEQRANGVSLAQTLLADAMATDDALPLLGFALQKLYDAQERPETNANANATFPRTLGFAAYEKLGGLAGAIGTVAAEAYAALDAKAQAELPGLLNALAVPSADGTRETARPSPIDQWPLNTPGRRLIDTLTTIRVLVSEQGTTPDAPAIIRVAHEALFSHWEQAAKLLNDSQQNRLLIEDFRQKANIWDAEDRPRDRLLTSPRDIANATAVRPLVLNVAGNAALMAFIDTSVSRAKRQRVVWYSSAAAIALTLVGTTGWAVYEASAADHQASMARGERSRAVAQLAEQAIDRGDAMTGILLARSQLVQGDEANWTSAAQGALVRGVLANLEIATLHGGADEAAVSDATFSFDSNHVITQLEGGAVWYRENIGRGRPSLKLSGSSSYAFIRKISQDRRSIMTAYQGGNFEIMGLDGKILKLSSLIDKNNYLPDFDFSNDGMKFVSVFPDYGTIRFWTYNGKITANVIFSGDAGHEGIVSSYGFSPNGQYAITASDDGMIRAWLISGNQVTSRILHRHQGGIVSISFSPDSRHIVAVFDDRTAQIIPLGDDNGLPIVLNGHDGPLTSASFSPDGRKVVTTSSDATSRVWMLSEARLSSILLVGHEKMVTSASFSPDSQRVVTTSADQTARVWTLAGDRTSSMLLTGHNGMITRAEFSGDGRHVVTTSTDRSARVWRINGSGGAFEILPSHSEHERYLAISSNGKYILERRIDGSVRIITLNAGKLT
ncbi:AAA family ATPase, partial [Novosphingobium sp.]|uniref:NACHT and WD repeat domain-containing protein n=3 Tax=unclassified Novosphingobium TaxID=2644732 RepID=UPI000BD79BFA